MHMSTHTPTLPMHKVRRPSLLYTREDWWTDQCVVQRCYSALSTAASNLRENGTVDRYGYTAWAAARGLADPQDIIWLYCAHGAEGLHFSAFHFNSLLVLTCNKNHTHKHRATLTVCTIPFWGSLSRKTRPVSAFILAAHGVPHEGKQMAPLFCDN